MIGVMVTFESSPVFVLASSVVDHGFESKTTSLVFVASLLSMLNQGLRTKTGWLGIGIFSRSRATWLLHTVVSTLQKSN